MGAALLALGWGLAAPAGDVPTVLVSRGAGGEAMAVNAQGAPFLGGAGGAIVRVIARNSTLPFVSAGGRAAGLAFDSSGNLYATDSPRKVILKVTPWAQVSVFANGFAAPEGIAWSRGELYVADPGASRLYRVSPGAKPAIVAADLPGASSVAVSADGLHLFVAGAERRIWRLRRDGTGRTRFAAFTGEGRPAGMALDERGNLYVALDGGGKVSVLDPQGNLLRDYPVPGPRVTAVAFGGADLKTLYISEAGAGALYRVATPWRSQLLPWESGAPLRIVEPVNGAILNRHDGQTTASGLRIVVKGSVGGSGPVTVNGAAAVVRDGRFEAPLLLREPETKIVASGPGGERHAIAVLWDRHSFPRYRVSTDDNIFFLRDIARHADQYKSIFENDYLAFWREMHRKYGTKVHHNIYYETEGFNLSQMPAGFRDEWRQNADWLQLTFHARANDPDHIYIQSPAEDVARDYRLVTREIERFAGKELVSPFTTVHWGEMTREAARALRDEGVRGLVAMGGLSDPDGPRDGLPGTCLYLPVNQWAWFKHHDYWKDMEQDIFIVRQDIVLNSVPLDRIVPHLERQAADPGQSEVMQLLIHEQYFYPYDRHYLPDFRARVERAIEWATRRGYKPVFYKDGFLGAP